MPGFTIVKVTMTTNSQETSGTRPEARPLEPLSPELHGNWRLRSGTFDFARDTPFIPLLMSEFVQASRTYPIVFSAADPSPLVLLGMDRTNLFVKDGVWGGGAAENASASSEALFAPYVPAFLRRYPFGYLKVDDSGKYILAIDGGCEWLSTEGSEGQPLFENGQPSALTQSALAFCDVFQSEAENTMAFVRALEARDLLIDRTAELTLADGEKHKLGGFRIVDRARYEQLDGPTIVEWHMKGWLQAVLFHLASLDLFAALARREIVERGMTLDAEPAAQPEQLN